MLPAASPVDSGLPEDGARFAVAQKGWSALMRAQMFGWLLLSLFLQTAAARQMSNEPKDEMGWFQRASDQMNLRMPGSAPFQMRVVFHALPGLEFLPQGKSQIITGDGVYEETWLSPHEWRREVTLGSYHAIEAEAGGARKMQASSDYEPSRVLMLLEALLNPISRYALSPEGHYRRVRWKTEHLNAGGQVFVRISTSTSVSSRVSYGTAYIFLPNGSLVQSNEDDLITNWQDDSVFRGKLLARHMEVLAGGVRALLTADVTVEAVNGIDPASLALPGDSAAPGTTLRPLHNYDGREPVNKYLPPSWMSPSNPNSTYPDVVFRAVIDRQGNTREAEAISLQPVVKDDPLFGMYQILDTVRRARFSPEEIDGSPGEVTWTDAYCHPS